MAAPGARRGPTHSPSDPDSLHRFVLLAGRDGRLSCAQGEGWPALWRCGAIIPEVDPESLERENNKDVDALGDRVHMLRQLTTNIHSEVNSHNRVLDNLGDSMNSVQVGIGTAATRFKRVFDSPQRRQTLYISGGIVAAVLFLYYLLRWRRS